MRFDPDILPELRKSRNPAERKNEFDLVRSRLMTRSPLPQEEWLARYAEAFHELARTDDDFRSLVRADSDPRELAAIQDRLDGNH